jgi:organic radical activating enzyme
MSESQQQHIKKIISIVDKTSPTFCLAKWHHVTLYLQTGETHSCYHPAPHKIDLVELKKNPSALHNTSIKKQERKEMLEGVQTKGCQYCWNIENMGPDYISDRHIKTASIFTEKRYKQIVNNPWDKNVNPEYIEISFGNECNFKCGYCHPKASSRFYNEIKQYGPITSVKNHRCDIDWMDLYEREEKNPYVDAWWRWWPTARKTLNILRITGGEPLMHVSTWKLLKSLKDDPMPKLELNINSNLGVKPALVDKLITEVNYISENNGFKRFKLYTSIDTWGARAEYIRSGLDLKIWERNFHAILSETKFPITFMITFNILSVTTFKSLLEKILEWRTQYGWYNDLNEHRIRFDTPHLKEPLQYDMNILPKDEFMPYMYDNLKFMEDNVVEGDPSKFSQIEFEKFRRVVDYMATTEYNQDKVTEGRRDFYNWFNELDTRRGTNFVTTFPEMEKFFKKCGKI